MKKLFYAWVIIKCSIQKKIDRTVVYYFVSKTYVYKPENWDNTNIEI